MVDAKEELTLLLQQARAGSEEAAQLLYDRYSSHIRRVVRERLSQNLRSQFDSVDFLQSVWATFFTSTTQPIDFDTPERLLKFLARVAVNKVADAQREKMRVRHGAGNVHSLEKLAADSEYEHPSPGPTPSQVAIAGETWENLIACKPEQGRRILQFLREGYTRDETAAILGIDVRCVREFVRSLPVSQLKGECEHE